MHKLQDKLNKEEMKHFAEWSKAKPWVYWFVINDKMANSSHFEPIILALNCELEIVEP